MILLPDWSKNPADAGCRWLSRLALQWESLLILTKCHEIGTKNLDFSECSAEREILSGCAMSCTAPYVFVDIIKSISEWCMSKLFEKVIRKRETLPDTLEKVVKSVDFEGSGPSLT